MEADWAAQIVMNVGSWERYANAIASCFHSGFVGSTAGNAGPAVSSNGQFLRPWVWSQFESFKLVLCRGLIAGSEEF